MRVEARGFQAADGIRFIGAALAALLVTALVLAGCAGSSAPGASTAGDPTKDKLAQVMARGTLVLWTDPDYAPQSMAVKGATRLASTKCAPNQMTAPEMTGYDAETGKLVAAELGLEPCFVTAPWDQVIAGNWGDQWDVAWGSGALEASRMTALYVTQPYYTTPANFFVLASSTYTKPSDLNGKQIGACAGCTHQQYLQGTLTLPGESLSPMVANPKVVTYASEIPGLADVAAGKIDAFLCSQPVGAGAITSGLAAANARPGRLLHVQDRLHRSRPDAFANGLHRPDQQGDRGSRGERQAEGFVDQVLRDRLCDRRLVI